MSCCRSVVVGGPAERYRRGRGARTTTAERAILIVALAVLLAAAVWPALAAAAHPASSVSSIRVERSQTLWAIARANRLPGVPTQRTVATIRRLNGLRSSRLIEGTVLQIPSRASADVASR